jgi:hypothetical protein
VPLPPRPCPRHRAVAVGHVHLKVGAGERLPRRVSRQGGAHLGIREEPASVVSRPPRGPPGEVPARSRSAPRSMGRLREARSVVGRRRPRRGPLLRPYAKPVRPFPAPARLRWSLSSLLACQSSSPRSALDNAYRACHLTGGYHPGRRRRPVDEHPEADRASPSAEPATLRRIPSDRLQNASCDYRVVLVDAVSFRGTFLTVHVARHP